MPIDRAPRKRRYVSARSLPWLRLVGFRYDYIHDAYVLLLIGERWGPVIRDRAREGLE